MVKQRERLASAHYLHVRRPALQVLKLRCLSACLPRAHRRGGAGQGPLGVTTTLTPKFPLALSMKTAGRRGLEVKLQKLAAAASLLKWGQGYMVLGRAHCSGKSRVQVLALTLTCHVITRTFQPLSAYLNNGDSCYSPKKDSSMRHFPEGNGQCRADWLDSGSGLQGLSLVSLAHPPSIPLPASSHPQFPSSPFALQGEGTRQAEAAPTVSLLQWPSCPKPWWRTSLRLKPFSGSHVS